MNANKLADWVIAYIKDEVDYEEKYLEQITTILCKQNSEIELLESELFVKGAVLKSYKEALEQIATGKLAGKPNNYKDTVYVMRQIALDALAILRKAQEK